MAQSTHVHEKNYSLILSIRFDLMKLFFLTILLRRKKVIEQQGILIMDNL
jgi:hypothetical protein